MPQDKHKTERRYPPLWERIVPISLVVIGVAVAVVLLIILSVALGLFPGSG